MMEPILQFWRRLSMREQWILGSGSGLLLLVLLVFYVWQPLDKARTNLRASLPKLRIEAEKMRAEVAEVSRLKAMVGKPNVAQVGIRESLEQSAAALGIRVTQSNPEGNNKLNVTFSEVPFDGWVKWLGTLQTQQRIRLESSRIESLPQPGMVKVQAVFAQG